MKKNLKELHWNLSKMNEERINKLEEKMEELLKVVEKNNKVHKNLSMKNEKEEEFPSEHDKEFIENSVELVLTKLCPDYPVKERSTYFELGNFFVLIELHNSKNHLIVGMKTEYSMKKELLELGFIFKDNGSFEITDFPTHEINNLVFKFFIELRKEIERKRLIRARSNKFQRIIQKIKSKFSTKDSWVI